MSSWRVIQGRDADAHDYIGGPRAGVRGIDQTALTPNRHRHALIMNRITYEVRGRIQLSQFTLRPLEFLLHRGEQDIVRVRHGG